MYIVFAENEEKIPASDVVKLNLMMYDSSPFISILGKYPAALKLKGKLKFNLMKPCFVKEVKNIGEATKLLDQIKKAGYTADQFESDIANKKIWRGVKPKGNIVPKLRIYESDDYEGEDVIGKAKNKKKPESNNIPLSLIKVDENLLVSTIDPIEKGHLKLIKTSLGFKPLARMIYKKVNPTSIKREILKMFNMGIKIPKENMVRFVNDCKINFGVSNLLVLLGRESDAEKIIIDPKESVEKYRGEDIEFGYKDPTLADLKPVPSSPISIEEFKTREHKVKKGSKVKKPFDQLSGKRQKELIEIQQKHIDDYENKRGKWAPDEERLEKLRLASCPKNPTDHQHIFTYVGKGDDPKKAVMLEMGWLPETTDKYPLWINPDWDPEKNPMVPYGKQLQEVIKKTSKDLGKATWRPLYTKDARVRSRIGKIKTVQNMLNNVGTIIEKNNQNLQSKDDDTKAKATAIGVISEVCTRLGSDENIKHGIFGASTLQAKHVTYDEDSNTITLKYVGKDKVNQEKVIEDPVLVENIRYFMKGKKPDDQLWTSPKTGKRPNNIEINKYLKEELGSPSTAHKFRHVRATEIFLKAIKLAEEKWIKANNGRKNVKMRDPMIKAIVNEAADQASKRLGNTKGICLSAYIMPTVVSDFWKKWQIDQKDKSVSGIPEEVMKKYQSTVGEHDLEEDEDEDEDAPKNKTKFRYVHFKTGEPLNPKQEKQFQEQTDQVKKNEVDDLKKKVDNKTLKDKVNNLDDDDKIKELLIEEQDKKDEDKWIEEITEIGDADKKEIQVASNNKNNDLSKSQRSLLEFADYMKKYQPSIDEEEELNKEIKRSHEYMDYREKKMRKEKVKSEIKSYSKAYKEKVISSYHGDADSFEYKIGSTYIQYTNGVLNIEFDKINKSMAKIIAKIAFKSSIVYATKNDGTSFFDSYGKVPLKSFVKWMANPVKSYRSGFTKAKRDDGFVDSLIKHSSFRDKPSEQNRKVKNLDKGVQDKEVDKAEDLQEKSNKKVLEGDTMYPDTTPLEETNEFRKGEYPGFKNSRFDQEMDFGKDKISQDNMNTPNMDEDNNTEKSNELFEEQKVHTPTKENRIKDKKKAEGKADQKFIAVDIDGTLAEDYKGKFDPKVIGAVNQKVLGLINKLKGEGWKVIIYTCRKNDDILTNWLKENKVPYDYINKNPEVPTDKNSKPFANVYLDDRGMNYDDQNEDTLTKEVEEIKSFKTFVKSKTNPTKTKKGTFAELCEVKKAGTPKELDIETLLDEDEDEIDSLNMNVNQPTRYGFADHLGPQGEGH